MCSGRCCHFLPYHTHPQDSDQTCKDVHSVPKTTWKLFCVTRWLNLNINYYMDRRYIYTICKMQTYSIFVSMKYLRLWQCIHMICLYMCIICNILYYYMSNTLKMLYYIYVFMDSLIRIFIFWIRCACIIIIMFPLVLRRCHFLYIHECIECMYIMLWGKRVEMPPPPVSIIYHMFMFLPHHA